MQLTIFGNTIEIKLSGGIKVHRKAKSITAWAVYCYPDKQADRRQLIAIAPDKEKAYAALLANVKRIIPGEWEKAGNDSQLIWENETRELHGAFGLISEIDIPADDVWYSRY